MAAAGEFSPLQAMDWSDLYLAALFEVNKSNVPLRIDEAEKAIAARSRELNSSLNSARERNSLDSALLALRVLRGCLGDDQIGNSRGKSSRV